MAKLIKKENPKITYEQRRITKRVNYSFDLYIKKEGNSKLKIHPVEIKFQNDEFYEANFEFRGKYNREDWRVLSMINNIITKIEKNIAKEQSKIAGNPA